MKKKMLIATGLLLAGCSRQLSATNDVSTNAAGALPSLEQLMPKFEVRSNAVDNFQVAFLPHDQTNWVIVTNIIPTQARAQAVIDETKVILERKYEIRKDIAESLAPKSK